MKATLEDALVSKEIGKEIRDFRLRAGLSIEKLAELVDIQMQTMQRIETGKTNLKVVLLFRIVDALGIQPDTLILDVSAIVRQKMEEANENTSPNNRPT